MSAEADIVNVLTLMEEALQRLEGRVSELARDSKEAVQRLEGGMSELARDSKEAVQRLEGRMSKVEDAQKASNKNLFQSPATNVHSSKIWQSGKPAIMHD
jgi:hypothetical protein